MTTQNAASPTIRSYLSYMFSSPIASWWALVTGGISIIAWVFIPGDLVSINKFLFLGIFVLTSFVLFIGASVVYKAWPLFSERGDIRVTQIVSHENDRVFILKCSQTLKLGYVFEVYRKQESLEVPIGFIEVTHEKENGEVQANPIWIKPIHMGDIQQNNVSVENLIIHRTLSRNTLLKWIDDQAELKVQQALRRGGEA